MIKNIKFTFLFFVWLTLIITFNIFGYLISANKMVWLDQPIINFFRAIENPLLTKIYLWFTFIGDTPMVIAIFLISIFILYFALKHRTQLVFLLVVLVGSTLINNILKIIYQRERPIEYRLTEASGYSFPSGHSMASFTLYIALSFLIWKHIPHRLGRGLVILFTIVMIFMIGTSRIYLGVHYPSDIIGGYLVSASWLIPTIYLYQWYLEKKNKN